MALRAPKQLRRSACIPMIALSVCATFPNVALAQKAVEDGASLARLVHERPDGDDAVTQGRMILQERGRSPRERSTLEYRLDLPEGETRTLVRFLSPADVDGTGLLVHDHADGSSDQWLYLPALDRSRRIASGRRGGRFVGSDLFFEDLEDRQPDLDEHRLLGETDYEGTPVLKLESVPVAEDNSVYSKRISWVHVDTRTPLRVDFYQTGADDPVKNWTVQRLDRVDGYWTVMESTVQDLTSGHRTRLIVDSITYDSGLTEDLFTNRGLTDPDWERRFRP